jgi:hypothetical protein
MTVEDVSDYFRLSRVRLCADLRLSSEFSGYTRAVYVARDCVVVVEYEQYNSDEGGAYFYGQYPGDAAMISAIEQYLGKPLDQWQLAESRPYPPAPENMNTHAGTDRLLAAIEGGTVPLPPGVAYELRGCGHWQRGHFYRVSRASKRPGTRGGRH